MTELPPSAPQGTPSLEVPPAASIEPPVSAWSVGAAAAARGPVEGFAYAGVLRRFIALIIDLVLSAILIVVPELILFAVWGIAGRDYSDSAFDIAAWLIAWVVFGAYFVLGWRQRRGTQGQRWFGMQVGNDSDGTTLTWQRAAMRWAALTIAPLAFLQGISTQPFSGLLSLLLLAWAIALLVTTATSPTEQGWHDRWAGSLVVRRA